jgi:hypothetical protein
VHDGAAQVPPVHTRLPQSAGLLQAFPLAHPLGQVPPQSTSASPSSLAPSKQWVGAQ